jgi:rfaE bifunctional protein nucleotidyltransferase chain/domain
MIIAGKFQFLHTVNYAWALKAKASAQERNEQLTIKLYDGDLYTFSELSAFLSSFRIADSFSPFREGDTLSVNIPDIPGDDEAAAYLSGRFQSKIGTRIFEDVQSFLPVLQESRHKNRPVITTNGCFDILHPGHLKTLQSSRKFDGVFVVLINSDNSIKRLKGAGRPVHDWFFRASLLSEIQVVDFVVVFRDDSPLQAFRRIQPVWHIKGGSYIPERVRAEADLLRQWGGRVHFEPMAENYSTTVLLDHYGNGSFPV